MAIEKKKAPVAATTGRPGIGNGFNAPNTIEDAAAAQAFLAPECPHGLLYSSARRLAEQAAQCHRAGHFGARG
jgi:hypothetical protein